MRQPLKVFLGGTCNGSLWRQKLIPLLRPGVDYFDPVVPNWTPACQDEEIRQRESADIVLYVITPKMAGFYSIAEVVEDSIKRPNNTVMVSLPVDDGGEEFSQAQLKSLRAVERLVARNGGMVFDSLESLAKAL